MGSINVKTHVFLKGALIWISFIPIPIVNGVFRNYFYAPFLGELLAHQVGTIIVSLIFVLYIYLVFRKQLIIQRNIVLILIGLLWVSLTIVFEFGFGHYIMSNSWEKLLFDYNLLSGRIWSLFLLVMFFSPISIKSLRI